MRSRPFGAWTSNPGRRVDHDRRAVRLREEHRAAVGRGPGGSDQRDDLDRRARRDEVPAGKRNVSMVFQSYALFPHLTVKENIAFGLAARRVPKQTQERRVQAAAEAVGCAGLFDRHPYQLSGGERQRVALAGRSSAGPTSTSSTSRSPTSTRSCACACGRS